MVISNIVAYVGISVGSIVSDEIPLSTMLTFIPINGLGALMYLYFAMICQEWAQLLSGNNAPAAGNRFGAGRRNAEQEAPAAQSQSAWGGNSGGGIFGGQKKAPTLAELAA